MKRSLFVGAILVAATLVGALGLLSGSAGSEAAGSPPQAAPGAPTFQKVAHIFYPRPRQVKPPWAGGGGGPNSCDAATGVFIRWPEPNVTYAVSTSALSPSESEDALAGVQAAFAAWSDVAGSSWTATYAGPGADHASSLDDVMDGQNSVTWESLADSYPNAIAVTFTWRNLFTMDIVEVDTVNNLDLPWDQDTTVADADAELADNADAFDVQNIMAHEVGHWLHLGHVNLSDHTMYTYGSMGELQKRTLACGDEDGIQELYPDGSGSTGDLPGYCKQHPERDGCS